MIYSVKVLIKHSVKLANTFRTLFALFAKPTILMDASQVV